MSYARAELLRMTRDRMTFFFTVGFPLILFWVIAGPNVDAKGFDARGVTLGVYYMCTMAAYGAMIAVISLGGRIASERQTGWTRQLRISPLTPRTYFRTKLGVAFLAAGVTIGLLYVSGFAAGIRLPADRWLVMTGLIVLALVPFAALGVWMGHLLTVNAVGPAVGAGTGLLALLSGFWFPINSGIVREIVEFLPSRWLVEASQSAITGETWPLKGWIVVLGWSALLTLGAVRTYRRDAGLR